MYNMYFFVNTLILFFFSLTFFTSEKMYCSINKRQSVSFIEDTILKTKIYYRKGFRVEDEYINGRLNRSRYYIGSRLIYLSPITKDSLPATIFRLKSGNHFLYVSSQDTLEIINPGIPALNFDISVVGGIIKPISERTFLLRAKPTYLENKNKIKIYVFVQQEMHPKIKIPKFIADSIEYTVE